jgi:hypothetical protein
VFDRGLLRGAVQELAASRGLALYEGRVAYVGEPPGHAVSIEVPISRVDSLEAFVQELFPSVVDGLYFVKASDWSSETEYRFLLHGDVADYEYVDITKALTSIFVGPRFPAVRLDDLTSTLWGSCRWPDLRSPLAERTCHRSSDLNGGTARHPAVVGSTVA